MNKTAIEHIEPESFEPQNHWYPNAMNATVHPMINYFFNLSKERIVNRYCHLHPQVDKHALTQVLSYVPKYYFLSGADLLHVTTEKGNRHMIVLENNSCPSGQKSMPLLNDFDEQGGYRKFIDDTFRPFLKSKKKKPGSLAVIYDKNYMEASGYAAAMADSLNETVYLVPFYKEENNAHIRIENEQIEIQIDGNWTPLRAAFRYLTQSPWDRLPMQSKTVIFNPVIACLAGGRNKLMADKAYSFYNSELANFNMGIQTPETIRDVHLAEIPLWVKKLGGRAVIKIPYSNAGQGVYTIINEEELEQFMSKEFVYDRFIVQSLIGNYKWSSEGTKGRFYHVGTVPNLKNKSFVLDFRIMIHATSEGYKPMAMYARRAKLPLVEQIAQGNDSWDYLGTNLSYKDAESNWQSDTSRLLLMDRKGFNLLGIGLDDLVDGYIQTVLSSIAIDKMAQSLVNQKGAFRKKLFKSLNDDQVLFNEIMFE